MTSTTLTQSTTTVYEYSLTVVNSQDNDTQHLTAAFTNLPSPQDWQQWLSGWLDCGYSLATEPVLIRTF